MSLTRGVYSLPTLRLDLSLPTGALIKTLSNIFRGSPHSSFLGNTPVVLELLPKTSSVPALLAQEIIKISKCSSIALSRNGVLPPSLSSIPALISDSLRRIHVHKGSLRSGEEIKVNSDLIVLGDVHSGASIEAKGGRAVVISGALSGRVSWNSGGGWLAAGRWDGEGFVVGRRGVSGREVPVREGSSLAVEVSQVDEDVTFFSD